MRIFQLDRGGEIAGRDAGVLAIGNFDGVHRGHRAVIAHAVEQAARLGVHSSIMTFEPYPLEYFRPEAAPPRLSSCRHKFELLSATGIERVYCARFGARLAATTAEDFISAVLAERLGVSHVVVGADFRFGAGRRGDVAMLRESGVRHGFGVTVAEDFVDGGERISSSRIRQLLANGELDAAATLLGRPFSHLGRVIHGDKRGRTWGFPTANFAIRRQRFPISGVFAVSLRDGRGFDAPGVANVGRRPTVGGEKLLIEVHLLDFKGDLYGRRMEVVFHRRLREERRFDGFDALRAQILADVDAARDWHRGEA